MNLGFPRSTTARKTLMRCFSQRRDRSQPKRNEGPIVDVVDRKRRSFPTNLQIPYEVVQVRESDGSLRPSTNLPHLLASVDKSTHLVRLISHHPPIVRVLTHLEDKTHKLERKADGKARQGGRGGGGSVATKEVRLSWNTSDADYQHKMAMARRELEKGDVRVEFFFGSAAAAARGNGGPPSGLEMNDQLQRVADSFADVSNEWKERGVFRGSARLYLQSTTRPAKVVPSRSELEELARKALERSEKSRSRSMKDFGRISQS